MARSIILLLDSFGIGYAHDAEKFGDSGADTLGHICEWMEKYYIWQVFMGILRGKSGL